jgi:hypothetical protein
MSFCSLVSRRQILDYSSRRIVSIAWSSRFISRISSLHGALSQQAQGSKHYNAYAMV